MKKPTAGLLMYRRCAGELQVLLVHPGGPLWAKKDAGAWSIPKGGPEAGEELLAAAQREFAEETGIAPAGPYLPLGTLRQPGGRMVAAWAFAGDCDPSAVRSNTFTMEWPPRSGRQQAFPEVDRAGWFAIAFARDKILPGQRGFLDKLVQLLEPQEGGAPERT